MLYGLTANYASKTLGQNVEGGCSMRHLIGLLLVIPGYYGLHCGDVMLTILDFGSTFEAVELAVKKERSPKGTIQNHL